MVSSIISKQRASNLSLPFLMRLHRFFFFALTQINIFRKTGSHGQKSEKTRAQRRRLLAGAGRPVIILCLMRHVWKNWKHYSVCARVKNFGLLSFLFFSAACWLSEDRRLWLALLCWLKMLGTKWGRRVLAASSWNLNGALNTILLERFERAGLRVGCLPTKMTVDHWSDGGKTCCGSVGRFDRSCYGTWTRIYG